jgi:hypothetical protein
MARVLLATSNDHPDLFVDDHPVLDGLRARGVDAQVGIWDDPGVAWRDADMVVLRSIWDYTTQRDAFIAWVDAVEQATPLHNPARIVRWNSHKHYLRDIADGGIPVIDTEWLDAGTTADVGAIATERGWTDMVVKPCVSAGARNTVRGDATTVQAHVDALLPTRDLMVQPYIAETESIGEHSLIYFGGKLSHVVRKEPALTGGAYSSSEVTTTEPHDAERELGEMAIAHVGPLLYARVDAVVVEGRARVMELELIEPQLFFRWAPAEAAERMVDLILADLG